MRAVPNFLTAARLVLGLVMFICLAGGAGAIPYFSDMPWMTGEVQFKLQQISLVAFVLAAVTDFFDGWVARRFGAESVWGEILDPIADKLLVAGTILGLSALGSSTPGYRHIVTAGALILFREFFVSALREVAAGRGVRFPVTVLAKWKTTLQLTALAAQLLLATWASWGFDGEAAIVGPFTWLANTLMWAAAAVTVWTGWIYWRAARRALA